MTSVAGCKTVLTDDQPILEIQFQKASTLLPELEELNDFLMEYEVFLLAGFLVNIREIRELKVNYQFHQQQID